MNAAFLFTSFLIVATPGTGALITIAAGLTHGTRHSFVAAAGCTLGIVPHLLAAITGLAAVVHSSAVAFSAVKWLGVGFLLWMAWSTWRDRSPIDVSAEGTGPRSVPRTIGSAVLANVLNPKLTIFFFAFLPQFVPNGSNEVRRMIELSLVFMAMTFLVFAVYGAAAAAVRDQVLRRPRVITWMRRTFAVSFLGLSAKLATEQA
jgi:threonine/homoserine/homoserine lactone efflux protein